MSMIEAIRIAYEKGYRITDDGKLYGSKGKQLAIKKRGKQRYPTFSVNVKGLTKSGYYGIPVHRYASFCFYGEEAFKKGKVVRHLDGNTENVKKSNIVMGTHSENNLDKCKEVRIRCAKIARASQGKRPTNSKLVDEQVLEIRKRRESGESAYNIAKDYNVSSTTIYDIEKRKKYGEI